MKKQFALRDHADPRVEEPAAVTENDDQFRKVRELNVREFLLAALWSAKRGLRRRSIDEFEKLLEFCFKLSRDLWPPEVARFLDRRVLPPDKWRPKVRRRVEWFKRPAHRMRSRQADLDLFYSDPNHMAAHWAALYIKELRGKHGKSKRRGQYKVSLEDGSKITIRELAVRRAIDQVNSALGRSRSTKRAHFDIVYELVKHDRTKRPTLKT